MTEAVVEQVELEAPAEEAFEFLSDTENFCTFMRRAELSRRVDLSRSSWLLKGPEGTTVEYDPKLFSKCLQNYRNRWVHGGASRGGEPDAVLDHAELDFKRRADGTTLLFLTYLADRADLVGEGSSQGPSDRSVNLDLVVIFSHLFQPEEPAARGASEASQASDDTDALISLLDEWAAEDPDYDEETLPALKENLDRNRPEYRKLFDLG